jgi:hypothetical protein
MMLLGYIPNSNQPVQWIPEDKKPSLFSFSVTDEGITLNNKFSPFRTNGYKATAYVCMDCKIVIAPFENI